MPGIVISISGNATSFEKEVARAEATALGMSKNVSRQIAATGAASVAKLQSQMAALDQFKAKIDSIRGHKVMSAEDSSKLDGRVRQNEVEEVTRSNKARKIWRQREETRTEEEISNAVESATRSIRARRLRRERAEARANAPMLGPDLDGALRAGAARENLEEAVDQASRRNRARRLLRQRADARAGGGGHGGGVGASWAQLLHVGRATIDSLASGQPIGRVILQQAPQAVQALLTMRGGIGTLVMAALPLAGVFGGFIAGAFIAYKHVTALIGKLSGFKPPDFEPTYIAKHLQKVGLVEESWRRIAVAVKDAVNEYNSATSAAERIANASKRHYDHLRKMNDLANLPERQKQQRELAINEQERAADLKQQQDYLKSLKKEAETKQSKASGVLSSMSSKAQDEQITAKNQANLDAANVAAKAIQESKNHGAFDLPNARDIFRAYNAVTNSGVSTDDLDAAEKKIGTDRLQYEKSYKESVDRAHTNETIRQPAEKLSSEAGEAFAKAAKLALEIDDNKKINAQTNLDARAELQARQAQAGGGATGSITDRERIGARSGTSVQVSQLAVARQQHAELVKHTQSFAELIRTLHENGAEGY